jgi:hypothetical protein
MGADCQFSFTFTGEGALEKTAEKALKSKSEVNTNFILCMDLLFFVTGIPKERSAENLNRIQNVKLCTVLFEEKTVTSTR